MNASSTLHRLFIIVVGFTVACSQINAQELIVESTSFDARAVEVIWNAETNHLKPALWKYDVVPQTFSPFVVSNLLALAAFTENDKTNNLGKGAFPDKSIAFYWRQSKDQRLGIYPAQGWIDYHDGTAQAGIRETPRDVPSDEKALQLITGFLPKLNLSSTEFATKDGGHQLRTHAEKGQRKRLDKATGDYVEEVYRRGVFLVRQIDGVDFSGMGQEGGLRMAFGNSGKVIDLQLVWRKLTPQKKYPVANRDQILAWIKQGKTAIPANSPVPGIQIKQLRINKVTPLYRGALGREQQNTCEPFALLECEVSFGGKDPKWERFYLESPILLSSPITSDR